jgi:hypothetical protein
MKVKLFLILIQISYVLSLLPWFVIWGLSFMSFDAGIGFYNTLFVLIITLYPVAIIVSSIFAWVFRLKRRELAIFLSLVPMIWVISFAIFMLWNW